MVYLGSGVVSPRPLQAWRWTYPTLASGLSSQSIQGKLYPCAFFSCRLSSAEHKYDVGDRKLLAIKLALEEWRHLLEGVEHSFTIFIDHKNLTYLKTA